MPPGSRRTASRWRHGADFDASRIRHVADSPMNIQLLEDQEWKACSLRSTMPSKVPSWNSEHGKTCTKDGDIFFSFGGVVRTKMTYTKHV